MLRVNTVEEQKFISNFVDMVFLLDFSQSVALTGYSYRAGANEHRMVLRGKQKKRHVVAFFTAPTYVELLCLVGEMVDSEAVTWFPDKYAPVA